MSDLEKAIKLLSYGVEYSPSTEIWKICNQALLLLKGSGKGNINQEFIDQILKSK